MPLQIIGLEKTMTKLENFDDLFMGDPSEIEKNLNVLLTEARAREDKSIYLQILSQIALAQAMQMQPCGFHKFNTVLSRIKPIWQLASLALEIMDLPTDSSTGSSSEGHILMMWIRTWVVRMSISGLQSIVSMWLSGWIRISTYLIKMTEFYAPIPSHVNNSLSNA